MGNLFSQELQGVIVSCPCLGRDADMGPLQQAFDMMRASGRVTYTTGTCGGGSDTFTYSSFPRTVYFRAPQLGYPGIHPRLFEREDAGLLNADILIFVVDGDAPSVRVAPRGVSSPPAATWRGARRRLHARSSTASSTFSRRPSRSGMPRYQSGLHRYSSRRGFQCVCDSSAAQATCA